ncbi:MAG: hypothetical protein AVDCRST_MAG10-2640, partial [uncultured Acidimicrobiales bacterium]
GRRRPARRRGAEGGTRRDERGAAGGDRGPAGRRRHRRPGHRL